jgi:glutathione synthase
MADSLYAGYPPALTPEQEGYLLQSIKDWSIQHGLALGPRPSIVSEDLNSHHISATNAPVTLFPSLFPRSCFKHARSIQKVYNELYAAIANDEDWLEGILKEYEHSTTDVC